MEIKTVIVLLLCLVSAAALVAGCTNPASGPVTTIPDTMVPAPMITRTSPAVTTTGTPATIMTAGTSPASSAVTETPPVSQANTREESVSIKARNFAFDVSRITVPAGSQVTVEFENEDNAPHNVAFYTTPSLTTTIYKGAIIDGPARTAYVFTAPSTPGTYFFRCDLHPSMKGEFVVI